MRVRSAACHFCCWKVCAFFFFFLLKYATHCDKPPLVHPDLVEHTIPSLLSPPCACLALRVSSLSAPIGAPLAWALLSVKGVGKDVVDSPCSGRTDSIYDSEPDFSYMSVDVDGNYCSCVPRESFQPRQILDLLIFSDGWIPRTCLSTTAWLALRAVAPYEASSHCSSFCTRRGATGTDHFSGCAAGTDPHGWRPGRVGSRGPRCWQHELLPASEHRLLPSFDISEKTSES